MIGIKSIAITLLAALALVLTLRSGALDAERLHHLSTSGAFAIGLFASLCGALLAFGARPGRASKAALAFRKGRPTLLLELDRTFDRARVRELPAVLQRLLFILVFACLGLATLGGDAVARIAAVPDELTKPSRAEYCLPEAPKPVAAIATPVAPPPPPVDQAGCALVKRAFALGYTKSLGSCAPKAAVAPTPTKPTDPKPVEVCERRQLDEPFAHYAYRKVTETAAGASPVDAAAHRVENLQTRFSFTRDLLADIKHSITGTPHASHHLFINLPDPHPTSFIAHAFSGEVPCAVRFADLALWPAFTSATPPALVLEHAFGQLLFATRFGSPASCSDYTIHWNAPRDTCTQLTANPTATLDAHAALKPIRAVLDRRRRQIAIRALAAALGEKATLPEPPPARAVTSVACLMVDATSPLRATGREITVDDQSLALREVVMPAISPAGAGPLDAYIGLALLLGGTKHGGPALDDATRMFDIDDLSEADAGSADAASGSGSGPASASGSTSGSGSGSGSASALASGSGSGSGPASASGSASGPASASGSTSGSGSGSASALASGSASGSASGAASASGSASGAASASGSASGAGSASASASASGAGADSGSAASGASAPKRTSTPAELPGALDDSTFLLVSLEPLVDADPFARTAPSAPAINAALSRPDVVEVYPFARHIHDFIDAFRRIYLPQRGRL